MLMGAVEDVTEYYRVKGNPSRFGDEVPLTALPLLLLLAITVWQWRDSMRRFQ